MRSSIGPVSVDPFSSGRSRSTTVPLATAATAALASPVPIPATTSRGRVPSGYSLIEPSGSLIWSIVGHISEVVGLPGDRDFPHALFCLAQINPSKWFLPRIPRSGPSLGPDIAEPGREVDRVEPSRSAYIRRAGPSTSKDERWPVRHRAQTAGVTALRASSSPSRVPRSQLAKISAEESRRSSPAQRGALRPRAMIRLAGYANHESMSDFEQGIVARHHAAWPWEPVEPHLKPTVLSAARSLTRTTSSSASSQTASFFGSSNRYAPGVPLAMHSRPSAFP